MSIDMNTMRCLLCNMDGFCGICKMFYNIWKRRTSLRWEIGSKGLEPKAAKPVRNKRGNATTPLPCHCDSWQVTEL
uniref:Uncharacterized protein n=1 Tax=Pararge aegeria TaxID=116150 RepID=S4P1I1_9NEOP